MSGQRIDKNSVMWPQIDALKERNQIREHLGRDAVFKCWKKLKNKSHCLDDFVSQEVSDITRFLNLHENHLTRGKKSRFHIGEYRIV